MASASFDTRAVRTGRFRFRAPPLFVARIRLHTDRLEGTGWHLHGHYCRTIVLRYLLHADAPGDDHLLLWLAGGEVLRLDVEGAVQWQAANELEQRQLRGRDAPH